MSEPGSTPTWLLLVWGKRCGPGRAPNWLQKLLSFTKSFPESTETERDGPVQPRSGSGSADTPSDLDAAENSLAPEPEDEEPSVGPDTDIRRQGHEEPRTQRPVEEEPAVVAGMGVPPNCYALRKRSQRCQPDRLMMTEYITCSSGRTN